jgi:hypothetical protein
MAHGDGDSAHPAPFGTFGKHTSPARRIEPTDLMGTRRAAFRRSLRRHSSSAAACPRADRARIRICFFDLKEQPSRDADGFCRLVTCCVTIK